MDTQTGIVLAMIGSAGLFVLGVAVALFFVHTGPRRAALVSSALPLALLLPTLAVSYASFSLLHAFRDLATTTTGGTSAVVHQCQQSWMVVRGGAAALAVVTLVALVLGLVPSRERAGSVTCSFRRALVLLLLPMCALLSSAAVTLSLRSALRVTNAVAAPAPDEARPADVDRVLADEGLGGSGASAIARISDHIARKGTLGGVGALVVAVILLGMAVTAVPLAAPVRVGGGFVAAASLVGLATLVVAMTVAMGAGDPLAAGSPARGLSSAGS